MFLEVTARPSHSETNKRVAKLAMKFGAKLVLNTDGHSAEDLISDAQAEALLNKLGLGHDEIRETFKNSRYLVRKAGF